MQPIVPEVTSSATVDSVRATRERRHRLLTRRARLRRIRLAQSRTPTTSYGLTTSGFEIRRRISAGASISGGDVTTLNEDNDGIRGGSISMVDRRTVAGSTTDDTPYDESSYDRRRLAYLERELEVVRGVLDGLLDDPSYNNDTITITAPAAYFDLFLEDLLSAVDPGFDENNFEVENNDLHVIPEGEVEHDNEDNHDSPKSSPTFMTPNEKGQGDEGQAQGNLKPPPTEHFFTPACNVIQVQPIEEGRADPNEETPMVPSTTDPIYVPPVTPSVVSAPAMLLSPPYKPPQSVQPPITAPEPQQHTNIGQPPSSSSSIATNVLLGLPQVPPPPEIPNAPSIPTVLPVPAPTPTPVQVVTVAHDDDEDPMGTSAEQESLAFLSLSTPGDASLASGPQSVLPPAHPAESVASLPSAATSPAILETPAAVPAGNQAPSPSVSSTPSAVLRCEEYCHDTYQAMLQKLCDSDPAVKAVLSPHIEIAKQEAPDRVAAARRRAKDQITLKRYQAWIQELYDRGEG